MQFNDFFQSIITSSLNQDSIVKILLVIFLSLYILFAVILMVQIRRFNAIINQVRFSPIFKALATGHLIAAVVLLIGIAIN
ncbi:MAG: hypothetical protein COX79_05440 [Candidatus Levybacteria bacterium CG_4_10_14_0_2_um_filter_36_16]|nr:MAG: hypothetical protein AUK12_04635 [Candidatus Levybacteria bacterium CG2_30_37_29]PIZ96333.1 MAG: hypothetical protein COX79_05440 [Candidatus Levybacteria bacterium CG_4_10_14_0_2_um_filter_36_16]